MDRSKLILLTLALVFLSSPHASQAQIKKATIQIDGLACPLCAYSLRLHLRKVRAVGDINIVVKEGIATLTSKGGKSLEILDLENIIQRAGFSVEGITIEAVGNIEELGGSDIFHINGSEVIFILEKNDQYTALRKELNGKRKSIKITGLIIHKVPEGHGDHPLTLVIRSYEITTSS